MAENCGVVRVDELSAHATWENGDCLVIRFDPEKMTKEQLNLLQHVRIKSDRVAVQLPKSRKSSPGHIVGFDRKDNAIYVSFAGEP